MQTLMTALQRSHDLIPLTFDIGTVRMQSGIEPGLTEDPFTLCNVGRERDSNSDRYDGNINNDLHRNLPGGECLRPRIYVPGPLLFKLTDLGYTFTMEISGRNRRISDPATLLFAAAALPILWVSRTLLPMDVLLRLLLPVFWLSLWTLACLGPGSILLRRLIPSTDRQPGVLALLSGAAFLAWIATLIALAGIFRPVFLLGILGLSAILGLFVLLRRPDSIKFLPDGLFSPTALLLLIPAAMTFAVLSTPPVMYDVLHYHLAFPEQWLLAGSFVEFPRESFSYYSSAHGMLYSYALAGVGPWGANAINWWMGIMATLSAGELGRRLGGSGATAWAAASFLLTPVVLEISGYATADLSVAAWAGGTLLVFLRKDCSIPSSRAFLLGGIIAGSAAAAKYLALGTLFPPLALLLLILFLRESLNWKSSLLRLGLLGLGVLIVLGPWLGRNVQWTGNPVYPYFHEVFGGKASSLGFGQEIKRNLDLPPSPTKALLLSAFAFIRRSFHPRVEGGFLGYHWLILLIAAIGLKLKSRMKWPLWLFFIGACVSWGFFVQYARFLLPALVAGAALTGTAAASLMEDLGGITRTAVLALLLFLFAWNSSVLASPFFFERLSVAAGQLSDIDFREHWDDRTPALNFIRQQLPQSAGILLIGEVRGFGFQRRIFVDGPYHQPLLVGLARTLHSASALANRLQTEGITHVFINSAEMTRLAAQREVPDYWTPASPEERRVIRAFLSQYLDPLFMQSGLSVYRLRTTPHLS